MFAPWTNDGPIAGYLTPPAERGHGCGQAGRFAPSAMCSPFHRSGLLGCIEFW
jgi:hypothetical protein